MRIGTNHGSLSDRILNRYGDTPLGMVDSALEFARIARDLDYHAFVFSMKASNPKIMIAAYRLLVARLNELGPDWNYPLHLGVTEAGEGEDARIKSAIGIGALLADGIGDTIRVSLTEDSTHEIPVARALLENIKKTSNPPPHCPPVGRTRPVARTGSAVASAQPAFAWDGLRRGERPTPNAQLLFDPFSYQRRASETIECGATFQVTNQSEGQVGNLPHIRVGGEELIRVLVRQANFDKIAHKIDKMGDYKPEIVYENANVVELDPCDDAAIAKVNAERAPQLVTVKDNVDLVSGRARSNDGLSVIAAFRLLAANLQPRHPILLKDTLRPTVAENDEVRMTNDERMTKPEAQTSSRHSDTPSTFDIRHSTFPAKQGDIRHSSFLHTLLVAATNIGSLLCDGIGDAVLVQGEQAPGQALRLSYNILQAAGSRIFKTDYVACPSCGRTLFNLQTTTAKIKAATLHLKGVKIAIMGCIVNGPGEMADADFGYVGGAPGKVNLYVGKTPVKFNIPEGEAVDRLKDLIREHGKWIEPASASAVLV